MAHENLLEIGPIVRESLRLHDIKYAIVGGLVTDALLSKGAVIDDTSETITVLPDTSVSTIRANGTVRDVDILALTDDSDLVRDGINSLSTASACAFPRTSISLSGYDTAHSEAIPQFITRTVASSEDVLTLSIGEVRQEVPRTHLEHTWTLNYRDDSFAILHPVAHIMSYKTRSITGIRPKDRIKVGELEKVVAAHIDAANIADFSIWEDFARCIEAQYSLSNVLRDMTIRRTVMALGRTGLGAIERSPFFVRAAQDSGALVARLAHVALKRSKPALQMRL